MVELIGVAIIAVAVIIVFVVVIGAAAGRRRPEVRGPINAGGANIVNQGGIGDPGGYFPEQPADQGAPIPRCPGRRP